MKFQPPDGSPMTLTFKYYCSDLRAMALGQYYHKKTLTDTTEAKVYNNYITKTLRKLMPYHENTKINLSTTSPKPYEKMPFLRLQVPYHENTKCNVLNEIPASGSFSNDINFQILLY